MWQVNEGLHNYLPGRKDNTKHKITCRFSFFPRVFPKWHLHRENSIVSRDGQRSAAAAQRPRRGVGIPGSSQEAGGVPGPGCFDTPPLFLTVGGTDNVT